MTLEDYLEQDAILYPSKVAVVCGNEKVTYKELYERVLTRYLEYQGKFKQGQIITIRASQSIVFLEMYFALHLMGCVVAPLEKNTPDSIFEQISKMLSQYEVPDGAADILYTTGTTGNAKGVIVSHRAIVADAENLIEGLGFSHDLVFVVNGPLNHIGSLSKIYPIVLVGATLIITDGLKDINCFYDAFDYPSSKFATFLVPASIRILIRFSAERLSKLSSKMEFVETGAAAISHDDMIKLCQLLPKSRLYNTYASTETGIISTYNFNDGKCIVGCLGKPMKHSKIYITENGLIACKGDTIMSGYIGDTVNTTEIMHDETIFTSDIGTIDSEGMLHLTGRMGDVINVGGFKVSPSEVEEAALSYPGVIDCICISVNHPITGVALKLLVVVDGDTPLNKRLLAHFLKTKLETYKIPVLYEKVESIKRTFNGKIDRKYYINEVGE